MSAKKLNIVVPMAGYGSRFAKAGYELPKPLIDTKGKPMIEVVVENLTPSIPHKFIFICQNAHLNTYGLRPLLQKVAPGCEILGIDGVTEGAACTVLLSKDLMDLEGPLMIANCDQYVDIKIDDYLGKMEEEGMDGLIMSMTADDPKWSYARYDENNNVTEVIEKVVVSDEATVGIYNYSKAADFVDSANEMIEADDRVKGEFYVAPVYNYLIRKGHRIGFYNIGEERNGMYGLGIPEDLEYFNANFDFSSQN